MKARPLHTGGSWLTYGHRLGLASVCVGGVFQSASVPYGRGFYSIALGRYLIQSWSVI